MAISGDPFAQSPSPGVQPLNRRQCCQLLASMPWLGALIGSATRFQFKYLLASCLYGYTYLGEILPEVASTGSAAIDLWPKVHGNQREQLDDLGEAKFLELLKRHQVQVGCLTQYPLGPFGLTDEMRLAKRLGCSTLVTGSRGPRGLQGDELKKAIRQFIESMKPHLEVAAECGVTIAIENHGNQLIESRDSLLWLAELRPNRHLGIALAPYHLPQDAKDLADLITSLDESIEVFYAWQHGMGCTKKLPKEQELLQLPGRGDLDFRPLVRALEAIDYQGWTEIFMHPVPRGISMLPSVTEVSAEVNRSRDYLEQLLKRDPDDQKERP